MMVPYRSITALIAMLGIAGCTAMGGQQSASEPPGADYANVGELTALPEFIPGMGSLYVQPATLPVGPFLAYDRNEAHVATVYMVPLEDMNDSRHWTDLEAKDRKVRSVDVTYNPGHPGVEEPHYHVMLWHVPKADAELE